MKSAKTPYIQGVMLAFLRSFLALPFGHGNERERRLLLHRGEIGGGVRRCRSTRNRADGVYPLSFLYLYTNGGGGKVLV